MATATAGRLDDPSGAILVPGLPILHGLEQWMPPQPAEYKDGLPVYEILGTDAQIVQFPVRPGRKIMCFAGSMAYMSDGMTLAAQLVSFGSTFGRLAGGGSLFQLTYSNDTDKDGFIACTPDYPGVIVPIYMAECPSGQIIALRDSFLCATYGMGDTTTDVSAGFNPASSTTGFCCSGFDFLVQTVSNGEWAFLMAMGTVLQKTLGDGESILVTTDTLLCFEKSVELDVRRVGNCRTCFCSGEGLFTTTLKGPGKVWLQSLSIDKMRRLFPPNVQQSGSTTVTSTN